MEAVVSRVQRLELRQDATDHAIEVDSLTRTTPSFDPAWEREANPAVLSINLDKGGKATAANMLK
eukprot:5921271-Karenia_brevis.AAC.1